MKTFVTTACLVFIALGHTAFASETTPTFVIAIHGGAGTMSRAAMTPERERAYHASLRTALQAGHAVLARGGSSLDAVVTAVKILEDDPLFNAGRGAVFTAEGRNELDAAIMDGATLNAGAVAAVTRVRNPIVLARAVMEKSPHVFLIGEGAEAFAAEQEIPFVDPRWFHTDERWEALERARAAERNNSEARSGLRERPSGRDLASEVPYGTVGAVALDQAGNLAAATSTGGMTNKRWGRVGDVPVIGAGTYADNATAAVSATGHGEFFIRSVVAHEIAARMRLAGRTLAQATDEVVMGVLVERGGSGGVIAVDGAGNVAMPFNSDGMYRGYMKAGEAPVTAIFRD